MVKYQATNDVWGFTWNGRRKESDYDTYFALNDKVKILTKDTPFAYLNRPESLLDSECDGDYSDQNSLTGFGDGPYKIIKFSLDRSQRMKWYVRYPAYTVVQGLSRTGGLLAVLNIAGIICLFVHQYMFEKRLKELDQRFLVEQQEALEKQLEQV